MTITPESRVDLPSATDGEIAAINLESSRQASWSRFRRTPERPGIAELILEQEQLSAQFLGDLDAFDRCEALVTELLVVDRESSRTALIAARVACMTHRFAEARVYLAKARACGTELPGNDDLQLSIDQATGEGLDEVLETRRRMAGETGNLEDLVPLAALLADLGEFEEADRTYHRALRGYRDVSPFPLAWVCFQQGLLWGECVPEPDSRRAAGWYQSAIEYVPSYVKARVHLAEIHLDSGQTHAAEALLTPAVSCGDPEVHWRLAEVMAADARFAEAETHMRAARSGFDHLLARHELAFADHGAEFYAGSGNDAGRAFELAKRNLANRPTLRAFEQAYNTAIGAGAEQSASELIAAARKRWGETTAFQLSTLAAKQA